MRRSNEPVWIDLDQLERRNAAVWRALRRKRARPAKPACTSYGVSLRGA
jgi:hypothetical protein